MKYVKIKSIEKIDNVSKLYDIEVDKTHCFFANDILVHNSSATFYYKDGVFGVCSRNLELTETEENSFWKFARIVNLEERMKRVGSNIAIQGELIGEGIQGNPYKIKGQTVRFFNAFNIDTQTYYGFPMFLSIMEHTLHLETVPVLSSYFRLPETIDEMIRFADAKSVLNPEFDREGIVVRSLDRKISFKVISNKFLLKHEN